MELIKFMFSGFWSFVGFIILTSILLTVLYTSWESFLKYLSVRRNGYPPDHCDSLGSFKEELKDE